jgi:hypothetical protein
MAAQKIYPISTKFPEYFAGITLEKEQQTKDMYR